MNCEREPDIGTEKVPMICEINFETKDCFIQNIVLHHEGNGPFKCEICDYSFSRKSKLNQHVSSVHEEKKPFKCEICNYSF